MYYRGITHALLTITRDEGYRGLYKGMGTTLMVQSLNHPYTVFSLYVAIAFQKAANNKFLVIIQIVSRAEIYLSPAYRWEL